MQHIFFPQDANWINVSTIGSKSFICGFCGDKVSSNQGYYNESPFKSFVYICPSCCAPIFFAPRNKQIPSPAFGNSVGEVPELVNNLYEEARKCTTKNCYTGAVLLCRKILMHIAVEQGAKEGESFVSYVDFLAEKGFVPPNGKSWVDHIRSKGNEANHEIVEMNDADAKDLIKFVEMLLKFIYEYPNSIPKKKDKVEEKR